MNAPTEASFDTENLYREETYTDRRVGTLRVMIPVKTDGSADPARPTLYVGQVSVMTPMGALPITFEVPGATTLADAIAGFAEGAKAGIDETMRELQQMRREQASGLVIPEAGGGVPGGGRIRMP